MKMSGISVIQESVQEAAKGIADIRSTIATLMIRSRIYYTYHTLYMCSLFTIHIIPCGITYVTIMTNGAT